MKLVLAWPEGGFGVALAIWLALAGVSFVALLFVAAPYGRYAARRSRWSLPGRWGWLVMEAPAALTLPAMFVLGSWRGAVEWIFLLLWLAHYVDRAFLFPFRLREGDGGCRSRSSARRSCSISSMDI